MEILQRLDALLAQLAAPGRLLQRAVGALVLLGVDQVARAMARIVAQVERNLTLGGRGVRLYRLRVGIIVTACLQ